METKYFSLGQGENSRLVKFFRLLFGAVCIAISIFWMIFNIRSLKADGTLWITIIFLSGFGFYQIWAGLGRTTIFIEISKNFIRLKKNPILPSVKISSGEIKKIELFPLNLIFYLSYGKKIYLRFGTTYTDNIDPIKSEIEQFASGNNIYLEIKREEI